VPEQCRVGEVFQRQPNGQAELVVVGTGLTRGDAILWNGHSLKTNFASSRALSVDVPSALLESPGEIDVTVEDTLDPTRSKLRARFVVRPPR
jgi:NAD(P)H-hydrate repair Nnr-like enzyme with NAD(P)H-hydrate epimerase domain